VPVHELVAVIVLASFARFLKFSIHSALSCILPPDITVASLQFERRHLTYLTPLQQVSSLRDVIFLTTLAFMPQRRGGAGIAFSQPKKI